MQRYMPFTSTNRFLAWIARPGVAIALAAASPAGALALAAIGW